MNSFDWFTWVVLPSIIFLTRVLDVTLGTMHIIFISRGMKYLAPLLGFVEVLISITVVSQIVGGARNFVAYLAYATGFAVRNYVGMAIESKLAIGTLVVRVILSGEGKSLVVMRKELERVTDIIESTVPRSFFTVEELRSVQEGIFPVQPAVHGQNFFGRKSK